VSTTGPDEKTQRNTPVDDPPSDRASSDARSESRDGFPRPFGPYVLLGAFGKGGMGEVYLARRGGIEGIEKLCVLKLLRADLAAEKEYIGRFLDEARVVIGLQHAHICPVFDVGRVHDALYLAMEYLQGVNLRHVVDKLAERDVKLPQELAAYVVGATLAALHHAHHHEDPSTGKPLKVVHRDVSPHNIMITFQGEVKLIDFGLAASAVKREETESQLVMGKVAYMSPEQARGDVVDARTDQFAIAIVLFELLTGTRFYGARKTHEIWQVVGPGGYVPEKMAELDDALRAILMRALSEDPRARFLTCEDFREELLTWLSRKSPTLTERRLRELMQETFVDEIESQRAMAQRLLARDEALSSAEGDPTFSSGPTVTSMLKPAQRKAAVPPGSGSAPSNSQKPSSPSARSPNANARSPSGDSILRDGLTLAPTEHDSGTEATLSSTKMAFPTVQKRTPAFAAMSALALFALVALFVMVVREVTGAAKVTDSRATPVALTHGDGSDNTDDATLPSPTAVVDTTTVQNGEAAHAHLTVDDGTALHSGPSTSRDDAAPDDVGSDGVAPVDDALDSVAAAAVAPDAVAPDAVAPDAVAATQPPIPSKTTPPRPLVRPTAKPAQPVAAGPVGAPVVDVAPVAPVVAETPAEVSPPIPAAAAVGAPAPALGVLYERLTRCPNACAQKVIRDRSLEELQESTPEVIDAFRTIGEHCAARCPR
jgi:serine/threonine protein kinase